MSLPTSTTPVITSPVIPPVTNPTTTTSTTVPVVTTTTSPTPTSTQPTNDPNTPVSSDDPTQTTSRGAKPPKASSTKAASTSTGADPAPSPPGGDGTNNNGKGESNSKSVLGPVIGAIAAVLVIGFLVAVFVMRKRKAAARKRRLDFLGEGNNEPITSGGAGAIGAHRPSSISSTPRPSNQAAHRPMEMASVGAKPQPKLTSAPGYNNNNNNNNQQGYQQVPYGQGDQYQYPDQQYQYQGDQYDPYYAQRQQQQQGYYPDQQQGYYEYPDQQQQQNQFVAPGPLAHSSPSMSNSSAYPPPPPSTITATQSSPRTPLAHAGAPQGAYEKNAKEGYAGTQSPARNPQMVPEPEEAIKVPVS